MKTNPDADLFHKKTTFCKNDKSVCFFSVRTRGQGQRDTWMADTTLNISHFNGIFKWERKSNTTPCIGNTLLTSLGTSFSYVESGLRNNFKGLVKSYPRRLINCSLPYGVSLISPFTTRKYEHKEDICEAVNFHRKHRSENSFTLSFFSWITSSIRKADFRLHFKTIKQSICKNQMFSEYLSPYRVFPESAIK